MFLIIFLKFVEICFCWNLVKKLILRSKHCFVDQHFNNIFYQHLINITFVEILDFALWIQFGNRNPRKTELRQVWPWNPTEYGIRNTEYCKRYLGRSTGCNGTPRSNTEITCCKLVCVSFSLICHLHFDQPKASHKELLLKSITTVMLALTTPVMWTFVLICITGTHSH